jgi:hypothetical protein
MRAPDAIMEPAVHARINEYLAAGGQPQVAIESLSEHYTGARRRARGVPAGPAAVGGWLGDSD